MSAGARSTGPEELDRAGGRLGPAIRAQARELGFALVGIAGVDPTEHEAFYRDWIGGGLHGEMAYLARQDAVDRRVDLTRTMEGVRSAVVVAHDYYHEDDPVEVDDPSRGVIARYARGADYHRVVDGKLRELARWIDTHVKGGVEARAYVDTGPILERDLAHRAGLGWFGRNTMLIHPRRGSYFFLGILLLDLALEPDETFYADHCGSCRACLDACPTGALLGRDADGAPVIDARRCISYLTIELQGPIPRELRPLMGNRVYGCDICQEVCPFNGRFAEETTEPRYAARAPGERPVGVEALPGEDASTERGADDVPMPRDAPDEARGRLHVHPGTEAPSLVELLETALDPERWDAFSRGSAIRRAGRAGFARNVCVALGNWGSTEAVPALSAAVSDPDPLVRVHAAWALGRIPSDSAVVALERQAARESEPSVSEEIAGALGS